MRRKALLLFLLFCIGQIAIAQTFETWWKAVEKGMDQDLPATALKNLQFIRAEAVRQNNTAQLLRALFTEAVLQHEISPDSGTVIRDRIEAELEKEKHPVQRALWLNALGNLYAGMQRDFGGVQDTTYARRAHDLLLGSVENTALLGQTKTLDYLPVFDLKSGSKRIYNDDLLSIFTETLTNACTDNDFSIISTEELKSVLRRNLAFYQQQQHRVAALYVELQLARLEKEAKQLTLLKDIDRRYADLPENRETVSTICDLLEEKKLEEAMQRAREGVQRYGKSAPQLSNFILRHETPSLSLSWQHPRLDANRNPLYPGERYTALLTWNNLHNITLRFHRLTGVDASLKALKAYGVENEYDVSNNRIFNRILKKVKHTEELVLRKQTSAIPAYQTHNDSLLFVAPKSGIYLVELCADGKRKDGQLLYITRAAHLEFNGASLKSTFRKTTDVDFITGRPITSPTEKSFAPVENTRYRYGMTKLQTPGITTQSNQILYSDRNIYRPGQKVSVSLLVYSKTGDIYKVIPKAKSTIYLKDTYFKVVDSLHVTTDEFGVAAGEFTLPTICRPGQFHLTSSGNGNTANTTIRVEEYKRPKFKVTIDTIKGQLYTDRDVEITGRAMTFSGLPVAQSKVNWDWQLQYYLPWRTDREDNDTTISGKGSVTTDENGIFHFTVGMRANRNRSYYLEVNAEVVAPDGETQSAHQSARVNDIERPPKKELPFFTTHLNSTEDRGRITLHQPGTIFYDLVSTQNGIIEHKILEVKDSTTLSINWKPEYGDAATAYVTAIKEGNLHSAQLTVKHPTPDKRLLLKWNSFRSLLQPGQNEEWSLTVKYPDGKPAMANLMARLYDASLDAIGNPTSGNGEDSPWTFYYNFFRLTPRGYWNRVSYYLPSLSATDYIKLWPVPNLEFSNWKQSMFSYYGAFGDRVALAYNEAIPMSVKIGAKDEKRATYTAAPRMRQIAMSMSKEVVSQNDERIITTDEKSSRSPIRQNFAETAFFLPTLRTDPNGVVSLRFTLPESLTQWNFNAFAHDRNLNTGVLNDTVATRKLLAAEVATPRCLREGDEILWPVSVRNLSRKLAKGNLLLTISDATHRHLLKTFKGTFNIGAGQSHTENFTWQVPEGISKILVRVIAQNEQYSDGEEQEIPILTRRIEITRSVPFTLRQHENLNEKQTAAHHKLLALLPPGAQATFTTDTCRNALEEVASVVPQLLQTNNGSAYDQAVTLYGIGIAAHLHQYVKLSDYEISAYRATSADRLRASQEADGGWAWYKGMSSSPYITAQIATLLARLQVLTGENDNEIMLSRALDYLKQKVNESVERRKREKGIMLSLSEWEYNYLYALHLLGKSVGRNEKYLLDLASHDNKNLTMFGKSGQAVILNTPPYTKVAQTALQSLVEHTVYSEEMGRYFDTDRAFSGWSSYRIPTQTFAIESLQQMSISMPKVAGTPNAQLVEEMKLWLLQCKRTQQWNNSRATTDAVYSLLHQAPGDKLQLVWGSVTARYTLDPEKIQSGGSGFRLERQLQVLRGEKWVPAKEQLHSGEHVRWIYTLTADRDFDHVVLHSTLPAGFEALNPFSGYSWANGLPAYRMVRDAANEYFIEHLAKGSHTFTDEFVVTRCGRFDGGMAKINCVFAPEFNANSDAETITVTP